MPPIFKCLICKKDIERATKTFWKKKGHLLCSTCLDSIEKKRLWIVKLAKNLLNGFFKKVRLQVSGQINHNSLFYACHWNIMANILLTLSSISK
jgi:hypothetical protein